jgi:hypothetical protein
MEIRAVVDLPSDPAAAQGMARLLVYRICQAINPRRRTRAKAAIQ